MNDLLCRKHCPCALKPASAPSARRFLSRSGGLRARPSLMQSVMTTDLGPLPENSSRFAASASSHWIHIPSLALYLHPESCCPLLLHTGVPVRDHGCDIRLCLRRRLWRRQVRRPHIQLTPLEYGPENVQRSFLQSAPHPFQSRYYMCRSNRTFLPQCVCRRFGRGEVSRLTDVLQRAETEVERRLNDITRKFIWWMTSVCLL